ncbi:MAG TPA: hypothetical protein VG318_10600 [Actinomycetota bacterium]|nr:hypothetical protein [Actinomycetota bacterium]
MGTRWACALLLLLGACNERAAPVQAPRDEPARGLVAAPPEALAKCRRFELLRPACPAEVPRVETEGFRAHSSDREKTAATFFVEWGAPHPGITAKNAPPRFAHVNVLAGDLGVMAGFEIGGRLAGAPERQRSTALSLGPREWNGRTGELLLAPSYPMGGMEGDHLVFRWAEGGTDYSISLHAWKPLAHVEATLGAMVGSLP